MSVLSDGEIRHLITTAGLISDARDDRVFACAYEFRPGVVVSTGRDVEDRCVRDWTSDRRAATDIHAIQPGELVWIRTREKVSMPNDLCAFWWQTNRLSKQGLMLVNMSMVEPGYSGPLACLFVNFGNKPVIVEPDTVVAKLVFTRLGAEAQMSPADQHDPVAYDRSIVRAAMGAPVTFLDVGSLELGLDRRRTEVLAELEDTLRGLRARLSDDADRAKKEISDEAERIRKETGQQFESDSKTMIRKVLGAAALGFVVLVAATSFLPWLQGAIKPDLSSEIKKQVNTTLNERLTVSGNVSEVEELQRRVRQLEQARGK
ncbi:dCTP deaminase domain-containing protein [Nucisporomicrobium flavum]|uniref:dCTP deaminase n=1 Tax=Nucisporomicrobium flavum TaxID=2785915 RepID=UPI003C30B499